MPQFYLNQNYASFGINTVNGIPGLIGAAVDYREFWTAQSAGDIGNNYWPGVANSQGDWKSMTAGGYLQWAIGSRYINSEFPGVQQAFSPGYWELWWLTARTPWGTLVVGKRPNPFGLGMMLDGSETSSESVALMAPYGPWSASYVHFLVPCSTSDYFPAGGLLYGDSWNVLDTRNLSPDIGATLTYRTGPFDMGAYLEYIRRHDDQGGVLPGAPTGPRNLARDTNDVLGIAYFKYASNRIFLNVEIAHYNRIRKRTRRLTQYYEDWRWVVETGALLGPAKVTLMTAWASGLDRRAGRLIDRQGSFANGTVLGNSTVFELYSHLMVLSYGTGSGAIGVWDRRGNFTDAWCLAGRVDYAVAANLNLWTSFIWAERLSHGYGWGVHRPIFNWNVRTSGATQATGHTTMDNPANLPIVAWTVFGTNTRYNWDDATAGTAAAPAIPDSALGVEVDSGFEWQLLEHLNFQGTFSMWWPGKWFTFACIDRGVLGWQQDHGIATNWGINPSRTIDPIFGARVRLLCEF